MRDEKLSPADQEIRLLREENEKLRRAQEAWREVEERLRESEELHRYTIELSEQMVWTADKDGNFTGISPRYYELTGLPHGARIRDAIHPDDLANTLQKWGDAIAASKPYGSEFRLCMKDGSYRLFRAKIAPRKDENGDAVRWYGTLEDVHEHRQAELERDEAQELYRLAARATEDVIWDYQMEEERVQWSDSSAAMFRLPKPLGTTPMQWWEDHIHEEDRAKVVKSLDSVMMGKGSRWSATYRIRRSDGSYASVLDRGFIIRDDQGKAIRAIGAIVDLTERQRAEAEVRRIQAELVHISRVSAMGTMASTLAHELNQPLTAVTNYVRGSRRLLSEKGKASLKMAEEALEAAESSALRAGQIVRRLRELVARGNVSVKEEDLESLVQDASALAFLDANLLGVEYRIAIAAGARWVEVDRIQIQQVLINLVRNAIEAMAHSERRMVEINAKPISEELVEVEVLDTGSGIPPEVREELFSPFHSTKSEGMGIGLSISRTIIEAHGGKIQAEEREEGGTRFCFTLPRPSAPGLEPPL